MISKSLPLALGALLLGAAVQVHARIETGELQGRYVLSDGRLLEVARQGRRLTARLDGHERALRALSTTRLQTTDGRLTLDFDTAANGSVRHVRVTAA